MEASEIEQNPTKCPYCGKNYLTAPPERCVCGYYFSKDTYKEEQETLPAYDPQHYGVKGWLLLFCLSLTVFSPLLTLYNLSIAYEETSALFNRYPGMQTIFYTDLILSIALTAFSIYAGTALWNIKPGAVKIAKSYLLTLFAYTIIASVLPFQAGLPDSANDIIMQEVIVGAIRSVFYVVVWYWFLNVSVRVKATYDS
jgi:hypothetical protein